MSTVFFLQIYLSIQIKWEFTIMLEHVHNRNKFIQLFSSNLLHVLELDLMYSKGGCFYMTIFMNFYLTNTMESFVYTNNTRKFQYRVSQKPLEDKFCTFLPVFTRQHRLICFNIIGKHSEILFIRKKFRSISLMHITFAWNSKMQFFLCF